MRQVKSTTGRPGCCRIPAHAALPSRSTPSDAEARKDSYNPLCIEFTLNSYNFVLIRAAVWLSTVVAALYSSRPSCRIPLVYGMPGEMILSTGQLLRGRHATYRLLNALLTPTVFKAQVLESTTLESELYITMTPTIGDILAHRYPVRWSKRRWSPTIRPLGESKIAISSLESDRAHISAVNMISLSAIQAPVRIRRRQI